MPHPLIAADGRELDRGSINVISINWWHDDGYEYIYQIGKSVYAYYDDRSDFFVYEEAHVTSVIESSYPREDGYWEEKCVQFEVKPPLSSAKRGDEGLCRVWINTFFRERHTSSDSSQWARGENGEIIWFENYSAARKWINQDKIEHHGYADTVYPKGHYLYSHNEYAPREYKICK